MKPLTQLLRGVLFLVLALTGMAMAFIFMISTAIAIGVLYVVARIKGRPFGARAYWEQRQRAPRPGAPSFSKKDVVDVEMREIP